MIPRLIQEHLERRLARYPAVALVGPRQAGKTTLAKALADRYFDLEKPQDQLRLDVEWAELVEQSHLIALDEVQNMPELFPRLRAAIDEDRRRYGRFLLLGSVSPALMKEVGQALTGRLALCELSPFLAQELPESSRDALWRTGGYPDGGLFDPAQFPDWQHYYLQLMAQRDLPEWGLPAKPLLTERLFRMLAVVHGQTWNASQIGRSLGLSYHTVNEYVDFLEHAFLIRRLPAYAANMRKRLIRSPKVYWRDSGLLHALLGIGVDDDLLAQPWVGHSWEGWVIEQILRHLHVAGQSFQAFFLRTSDGHEIDLVLECRGKLWALEVKLTSAPGIGDLNRLRKTAELIQADRCVLVSRTTSLVAGPEAASLDLDATLDWLLGDKQ